LDPLPAPAPKSEPSPAARSMSTPMAAPSKPSLPPLASTRAAPVPLRANPPPRPAESDRFAISPGMGFNGRQALNPQPVERMRAPEPEPQSDPMAEIESLIGEAVRVQLAPPGPVKVQATPPLSFRSEQQYVPEPQDEPEPEPMPVVQPQQYAPVVPPLTHFAPRRASIAEQSSDPAEEAILAASADSGMDIGRLDGPSVSEESPYRRLKVKPQRQTFMSGGMRQYVGMAIAGTLLLAAGLGLYWVLNMGRSGAGTDAPVLTADATPVKVAPVPEVQAEDATPASPVLQQLDGASTEPSVEQLVSTDETTGQDVARVVGAETAAPADESEGGLANRKVRTVTVRPDGTIVSGEDSVAGAEELPVDRPNVPELPGATENVDLLGADGTALATADAAVTAAEPLASIDTGTVPVNTAALDGTAAVATGGILDPSKVAPKPAGPPNRSAMLAAFQATTTAPAPLAAADENTQDLFATDATPAAAAPVTNSGGGGAYVQLASSPSESDATSQARSMQSRFGSLFGGNTLRVVSADLGQKGVWYRVRLPVGSLSDANAICASIKANGGDCITGG
ncbi:MAG: SPOR domain-containing protein, partial [Devosia sp.]